MTYVPKIAELKIIFWSHGIHWKTFPMNPMRPKNDGLFPLTSRKEIGQSHKVLPLSVWLKV